MLSDRNHGEPFQADAEVEFCMLKTLSQFLFCIVMMMMANWMVFLTYRGYANSILSYISPIHSSIESPIENRTGQHIHTFITSTNYELN